MTDDYPALCTGCEQFVYEDEFAGPCPNCFPEAPFHAELRRVRNDIKALLNPDGEDVNGVPYESLIALDAHARALLAMPEESVAALVSAAQNMVGAASFGR